MPLTLGVEKMLVVKKSQESNPAQLVGVTHQNLYHSSFASLTIKTFATL